MYFYMNIYLFQKLFGHEMAEFRITIEGMWSDGKWQVLDDRPLHITPTKVKVKGKIYNNRRDVVRWQMVSLRQSTFTDHTDLGQGQRQDQFSHYITDSMSSDN